MLVSRLSDEFITPKAKENWLSYWKYFSHSSHKNCSVANCSKHQEQGIFVANPSDTNESVFVIPLCSEHSNDPLNQIEINDDIDLIPIGLTL